MARTIIVTYDGEHLTPASPLDLESNRPYLVTIDELEPAPGDAWSELSALAGKIEAPADWAEEHDHYLYGSPNSPTGRSRLA